MLDEKKNKFYITVEYLDNEIEDLKSVENLEM